MRKWLAEKLFDWAVRLDWDAVFIMSLEVVMIEAKEEKLFIPKKKRGRPLGSKDKKPRKRPVRKAGRPIPVANACTGATPFDEAVKLAFPRESNDKSSSRKNKSSSSEVQP